MHGGHPRLSRCPSPIINCVLAVDIRQHIVRFCSILQEAGGAAQQPSNAASAVGANGGAGVVAPATPRGKEARPNSLSAAKDVAAKLRQGKQMASAPSGEA